MIGFIKKYLPEIMLTVFVIAYFTYFSLFTINRYEKLYAHYFDLGIMHQTVYNTYKGIQTGDFSRILELTNPHNTADQVKRMAIHNDILLAFLAPFYFIHEGPETLLVIQSIVLAIGAVYMFLIAKIVLAKLPLARWLALIFAISYLLYPPIQKANTFEFHSVTLATTFLLAMFYYWLQGQYKRSFIFLVLSLFTKEQVGMTTALFGLYMLYDRYKHNNITETKWQKWKEVFLKEYKKHLSVRFAVLVIAISIIWIILSMFVMIPLSRGEDHFAATYYDHIKERPIKLITYPLRISNIEYVTELFGPTGFLSIASPIQLLIVLPEFGINLLSSNANMRNTYFHYNSVITPFIFISSIYAVLFLSVFIKKHVKKSNVLMISFGLGLYVLATSIYATYQDSRMPYAKEPDLHPWKEPQAKYYEVIAWKKILDDDQIKVSSSGKLAPHFTSRQYFYDFSWKYTKADYIVIDTHEVQYGYLKENSIPAYNDLQKDKNYIKIYDVNGIAVYRKIQL